MSSGLNIVSDSDPNPLGRQRPASSLSPHLRVRLKNLTIRQLRELLHPTKLIEIIKELAPFTWSILHTFSSSENRPEDIGKAVRCADAVDERGEAEEDWADDPNDDENIEEGDANPPGAPNRQWSKEYPGFSRNPVFVIFIVICMLAFTRNRATNVLPLILGPFFKISGTSSRVVTMLSNAGICRSKAKATDILPTPEDDKIVGKSVVDLIAEMIVAFTPGNSRWKDRKDIAEAVAAMMPMDRPLPPDKSDLRPFGSLDTNEGSKKGVVKVLRGIQERSTLSQKIWESIWRIFVGDWLASNNLRAARTERPFPFALQATHMIMRTHYGHAVEDPASLAAHKGLLNRKWDVNKPNYAAAKSLIRHSLIARILHCIMVIMDSPSTPNSLGLEDIQATALAISTDFATATAAKAARKPREMIGWHIPSISFATRFSFLNFWVKRVFIASGAGVTVEYIIRKGSAYVEAFRDVTHMVANFFGDPDRARRSKGVKLNLDLEALVTEMQRRKFHKISTTKHFVPATTQKDPKGCTEKISSR
ncbi:hypothetical protein B0H14DRAFT_3520171 [Mycena olivaceomarginata]|nr:hypothetical protein B0H14DRAFT_3520171 [Mycena olivaceomarginata]